MSGSKQAKNFAKEHHDLIAGVLRSAGLVEAAQNERDGGWLSEGFAIRIFRDDIVVVFIGRKTVEGKYGPQVRFTESELDAGLANRLEAALRRAYAGRIGWQVDFHPPQLCDRRHHIHLRWS